MTIDIWRTSEKFKKSVCFTGVNWVRRRFGVGSRGLTLKSVFLLMHTKMVGDLCGSRQRSLTRSLRSLVRTLRASVYVTGYGGVYIYDYFYGCSERFRSHARASLRTLSSEQHGAGQHYHDATQLRSKMGLEIWASIWLLVDVRTSVRTHV